MSYSVILSNGKSFTSLDTSGDYFASKTPLTAQDFEGLLSRVQVVDNGTNSQEESQTPPIEVGTHTDLTLHHIFAVDGVTYFCLKHEDTHEREALRDRADIEYIAMMTGVEL